jgi:hypothetical protein
MNSDPVRCPAWYQTPRGACIGARERQRLLGRLLFGCRSG